VICTFRRRISGRGRPSRVAHLDRVRRSLQLGKVGRAVCMLNDVDYRPVEADFHEDDAPGREVDEVVPELGAR
jgi:hypothetical protein